MNYLNARVSGMSSVTKRKIDKLIRLLDPNSGISVTRNVYPDMINPKSHVTHSYILETINRDAELSKLSTKDKKYLRRYVENVYGSVAYIN